MRNWGLDLGLRLAKVKLPQIYMFLPSRGDVSTPPGAHKSFELGIEPLELDPGVFANELPVGLGVALVSTTLPEQRLLFP